MEYHETVDERLHVAHLVSGDHERPVIAQRFRDQAAEESLGRNVETVGRLVQHEERGAGCESEREQELLLLAVREMRQLPPARDLKLVDIAGHPFVVEPRIEGGAHGDEFPVRERGNVDGLGEHEEPGEQSGPAAGGFAPEHANAPRAGEEEPGHEPEQRRLSRPVQAEQTVDVAGLENELDIAKELLPAVAESKLLHLHHIPSSIVVY